MKTTKLTATEWDSVEQKQKFINQFKRFVESGFDSAKFPKWFYIRLSMTFGHIAHYSQGGFYDTFFTTTDGKVRFLEQSADAGGYGDPAFTYSDAENILKEWLGEQGTLATYRQRLAKEQESGERAQLARLQAKYL